MRKALLFALAVWTLGMTREAWSAPVPIENPAFSCTFPDGWMNLDFVVTDSTASLIKTGGTGGVFLAVLVLADGSTNVNDTSLDLSSYVDSIGVYEIKNRGVKKIGDYDFQIATFEYTPTDTSDGPGGLTALWVTSINGVSFTALLSTTATADDFAIGVAEMESALTTLDIRAVGTRIAAGLARSPAGIKGPSDRVDILGRNLRVSPDKQALSLRIFQASPR